MSDTKDILAVLPLCAIALAVMVLFAPTDADEVPDWQRFERAGYPPLPQGITADDEADI